MPNEKWRLGWFSGKGPSGKGPSGKAGLGCDILPLIVQEFC